MKPTKARQQHTEVIPPFTPHRSNASEGTPGPWIVTEHPTKYPDLFTYNVVAPQGWTNNDGSFSTCMVAFELDSKVDARLIAAAPQLLEACKKMIRAIDESSDNEITLAHHSIMDAVAKAEGRAQ